MSATLLLDGAMVILLVAVMAYAMRLNRKLAHLRSDQSAIAEMVNSLDRATERANEASDRLRRVAEEGNGLLQDSIKQAITVNESLQSGSTAPRTAARISETERDLAEAFKTMR